ncbi:chemocyanin-like [Phoenix dactylifera]|uniref:Plantacyanin n=1 Tax=Phoenix dactylifera TaxID=42345 RepID=A0A8B7BDZ3_PHODC|nr:chemocyanin-like [Phoenix dactylifera]
MAQGRGTTSSTVALGLVLICLFVCQFEIIESKEYIVGDALGWTFGVANWPNGKNFQAGDVLVFRYDPQAHNVVAVDAAGYNSCKVGLNSKVYDSGNDRISLQKGANYFFCSFANHCQMNLKIAVKAA